MNTHRWIAALLTCTVVIAAGLGRTQAQTLVPGEPPLTRDMVDKDIDHWELLLDIRLSAAQRRQFEPLRVNIWKTATNAWKADYLKRHEYRLKIDKLTADERVRIQDENQPRALALMRASTTDPLYRLLLPIYEATTVAPGNPPLTRGDYDKMVAIMEWILDIHLTMPQRREGQEIEAERWKTMVGREAHLKLVGHQYGELVRRSRSQRAMGRVVRQAAVVEGLRKDLHKSNRWWLALYEAARKPGSTANPILAEGDPPLTQDLLNQYGDYLEWFSDRTQMGGWPEERLQKLRKLITADWEKPDSAGKEAFLADLTWWKQTFPKLSDAQRQVLTSPLTVEQARLKPQWAYRAYARNASGAHKQWAQAADNDTHLEGKLEQQRSQGVSNATKNLAGPGYEYRYVFDPRTSRYEYRYVPKSP